MGYPGPNVATATLLKRIAPVVCSTFQSASRDNTRCSICAYAVWEHAKFPTRLTNTRRK